MRAYDVAEVNRWVPDQMSTSSLDRGSKLRGVFGCVKAPHGQGRNYKEGRGSSPPPNNFREGAIFGGRKAPKMAPLVNVLGNKKN